MSGKDRRSYLTATVLDQTLLDNCADNFETKIEMVLEIDRPDGGTIYASDRNKYVGGIFYEALLVFPQVTRTVGEWLSPTLQFSTVTLDLSNADGRFNKYLPGGLNYNSFVGRNVVVKIGLAEQSSTYKTIFKGKITEVAGFSRSTFQITFIARDDYEKLNVTFPKVAMTADDFPYIEDSNNGKLLPLIYGDWTVSLGDDQALIPAYVLNGLDPDVIGGTRDNIQFFICENDLTYFDDTNVYLLKSDIFWKVPTLDVVNIGGGNKIFQVQQNTIRLWVDGAAYTYSQGDTFFVRVKGKALSGYDDNIVSQARDLIVSQADISYTSFDANWNTYRDKSSPSQSDIVNIKSRIWVNEPKPVMEYVLSLLEQVRLEAYIDKNLNLKLNSLHFEDWNPTPSFTVKNWDVVSGTLKPKGDDKNNFNRTQAVYDFHPSRNENAKQTALFRNQASIDQIGREISKRVIFPNLYVDADAQGQVIEILKIASSLFEIVDCSLTWRGLLLDIGDFVSLDISIGGIIYSAVPAMIRTKSYDPTGIQIPLQLWSMQLLPFSGYVPGYNGTVGGYNATIIQE
jgi:hypothetical protein